MRSFYTTFLFLCLSLFSHAQKVEYPRFAFDDSFTNLQGIDSLNVLTNAFSFSNIGGEKYVGIRVKPVLNFGKVGIGLDVPLYFNLDGGKFYTDEFKSGSGILRMISFLKYGRKKVDPVYVKLGQLENESIGYGSLLNNYSNSPSFEKRKVGIAYDILVKKIIGVEGLYSDLNFQSFNLFAIRPYVRPFGNSDIPVVKTLDFGFTYVSDKDNTDRFGDDTGKNEFLSKGIKAYGVDMGVLLINSSFINLTAYAHYSRIDEIKSDSLNVYLTNNNLKQTYKAGTGTGFGLNANMNVIGNLFKLSSRLERLWYTDNYIPQFFDAIYEVNKDNKIKSLANTPEKKGIYGSISASILDKILLSGNLLLPDNISEQNPATVQLKLRTQDLFDKIIIEGSYTKGGLASLEDSFKLDSNSLAVARFAYKITPILITGVDYRWKWTEQEENVYKAKSSIMPYVALSFKF